MCLARPAIVFCAKPFGNVLHCLLGIRSLAIYLCGRELHEDKPTCSVSRCDARCRLGGVALGGVAPPQGHPADRVQRLTGSAAYQPHNASSPPAYVAIHLPASFLHTPAPATPLQYPPDSSEPSQQQQQQPLFLSSPRALRALLHELGHAVSYVLTAGCDNTSRDSSSSSEEQGEATASSAGSGSDDSSGRQQHCHWTPCVHYATTDVAEMASHILERCV
jgi:hypothetical protein